MAAQRNEPVRNPARRARRLALIGMLGVLLGGGASALAATTVLPLAAHAVLSLSPRGDGAAVMAVSADGSTAVVGCPDFGGGRLYVYQRPTPGWQRHAQPAAILALPVRENPGGFLGESVALTADGTTIVAVAKSGAFVFRQTGPRSWSEIARLRQGADAAGIAISRNGLRIFIDSRRLYVFFNRNGQGLPDYVKIASLRNPGAAGSGFAVSGDGSTAVVNDGDRARVFTLPEGRGWAKAGSFVLQDSRFGYTGQVAVDGSGSAIAANSNDGGSAAGVVMVFARPAGGWRALPRATALLSAAKPLYSPAGVGEQLGSQLAMSDGGSQVIAGAGLGVRTLVFLRPSGGWRSENETYDADLVWGHTPQGVGGSLENGVFVLDEDPSGDIGRVDVFTRR